MKTVAILWFISSAIFGAVVPENRGLISAQNSSASTDEGEFIVEVRAKFIGYPQHYCYGALIDQQWALVTARCVEKQPWMGSFEVVVGSKVFGVKSIILHDKFKEYANDIALIRLNSRALPSETGANTIYLPYVNLAAGDLATFLRKSSSGKTESFGISVKPSSACPKNVGSIGEAQFCAGDNERSAIKGDEGGSLAAFNRFQGKVLVGLLSYAEAKPAPAVFTNVYHYTAWILAQLIRAAGPGN